MAKWVKWNIRVEHEVVFLRLSLLWGFSEDVLYPDNYTMLFCFFECGYICVLHSISFEIFVAETIYFIHRIVVIVQSVWHSLSLRNNLFVLARRIAAIALFSGSHWAVRNQIKEILNSLVHVSDIFVSRFAKIWQSTETYSPQTFSVTAAVVAPAVVICLKGQKEAAVALKL